MKKFVFSSLAHLLCIGLAVQNPVNRNGGFEGFHIGIIQEDIEGWEFHGIGSEANFYIVGQSETKVRSGA